MKKLLFSFLVAVMAVPVLSFAQAPAQEPVYLNGVEALRIGGNIKAPERVKYVAPAYPQEAKDNRIQGIVIIEAVVDEAGKVANTRILRSVPALDAASQEAVMQWEYTPTLLNGVPKPVVMTVTVNFTLQ